MQSLTEKTKHIRLRDKPFFKRVIVFLFIFTIIFSLLCITAYAAPGVTINFDNTDTTEGALGPLELLFLLTVLAIAPSLLIMMTSFTRIVIVLSFLRNAMGTQAAPPNQVVIGLALFLTLFIMSPVIKEIDTVAYKPYTERTITTDEAISLAVKPLKKFMLKQTGKADLSLFLTISGTEMPQAVNPDTETAEERLDRLSELGIEVIVPAFITSELKRAFTMGFLLYIPFLIIDMVVSSTLMSMGMVMLPPSMIAMPFKLLIFVLVDGWSLLFSTLVNSFR